MVGRGRGGRGGSRRLPVNKDVNTVSVAVSAVKSTNPSQSKASVTDGASSAVLCGTCKFLVSDDAIGCDRCEGWFHPASMCLGLLANVITNILSLEGEGILFVCLSCRMNKHSSPSSHTQAQPHSPGQDKLINQLSEMVMALTASVRSLTNQMDSLQCTVF